VFGLACLSAAEGGGRYSETMQIIEVATPDADSPGIVLGARFLQEGKLVAFPTETVYGLGANATDPQAVARIYEAKGRPSFNPLIVHVASVALAQEVVRSWPPQASDLAAAFWPGPLTLVLPRRPHVPDGVTAGLDSVAVRVPAHPVALALLTAAGLPVAAPSANRSMMLSPTTAAHVARSLGDAVDLILDGGPTRVGIESTVLDLTSVRPTILRPGMIDVAAIERVVGPTDFASTAVDGLSRSSPGMMERHYSPRARLFIVDRAEVADAVRDHLSHQRHVAALVMNAEPTGGVIIRVPDEPARYAALLYDTLHRFDDAGADVIVVERVPAGTAWAGVRDRLERAARR
jgi:L-threonylcarbamoyladenylate synthase